MAYAIPSNALTKEIEDLLQFHMVDTSKIVHRGDRIGSYHLLSPNGLTDGEVVYGRKYSSFTELKADNINWKKLYDGVNWFHFTAITPALSADLAQLIEVALEEAIRRKITVSVDLNYRSK